MEDSQKLTDKSPALARLPSRWLSAFGFLRGKAAAEKPAQHQISEIQNDDSLSDDLEQQAQLALATAETANLAKSNFLSAMSHELRTPINAIVGFCEILNAPHSEMLSADSRQTYLNTIIENANNLQSMINDILDVTRFERGSFQLVEQNSDAAEIVEAALKFCRKQAEASGISIVAHLIDDVSVRGDLVRLKQVVQNLLANAIKFSPQGSIVNIDMQRGPDLEFILLIRDAGIGMSDEDSTRVFDSFLQVEEGAARRFEGMGLGLSIARRIARLHGGDITLNGKLGIGTEARFSLPAARVKWGTTLVAKEQVAA